VSDLLQLRPGWHGDAAQNRGIDPEAADANIHASLMGALSDDTEAPQKRLGCDLKVTSLQYLIAIEITAITATK